MNMLAHQKAHRNTNTHTHNKSTQDLHFMDLMIAVCEICQSVSQSVSGARPSGTALILALPCCRPLGRAEFCRPSVIVWIILNNVDNA